MRSFDLSPLFRSSVGFDRLDKLFDSAFREAARDVSYPPYNIAKTGADSYRITMAVAGFGEADLDIVVHDNMLSVKGQQKDAATKEIEYLHRGIAQRAFRRQFDLADFVKVTGASLEHGLLRIELEREIPEAMKPRRIEIGTLQARVKKAARKGDASVENAA